MSYLTVGKKLAPAEAAVADSSPAALRLAADCLPDSVRRYHIDLLDLQWQERWDVAFLLEEPLRATGLVVEPLLREPLLVLSSPEHPLTQCTRVTPTDLEGEPVLLTEVGCSYRNLFKRTLAKAGVYPTTNLEMSSVEAIKQCVMLGMGITVLPAVAVQAEVAQGRLVALPWSEPGFEVVTQLIWHREKWQSPALKAFLSLMREGLGDLSLQDNSGE